MSLKIPGIRYLQDSSDEKQSVLCTTNSNVDSTQFCSRQLPEYTSNTDIREEAIKTGGSVSIASFNLGISDSKELASQVKNPYLFEKFQWKDPSPEENNLSAF